MVTHTTDEQHPATESHRPIPSGTSCFYCGYPLKGTIVAWWGNGADIYLHPSCVVELTIRMLRDVHEIECQTQTAITGGHSSVGRT